MGTAASVGLAILGIIAGTFGLLAVGALALIVTVLLFGASIISLALELDARAPAVSDEWVCKKCGGTLRGPVSLCPHCGGSFTAERRRTTRPA